MVAPCQHMVCLAYHYSVFFLNINSLWVNTLPVGIFSEAQVKRHDSCASLQPPDGKLLLSRAVLWPLRLLPLSTLQHHLPLLENEPPVLKEDVDEAKTHTHTCTHTHTQKKTTCRHRPAPGHMYSYETFYLEVCVFSCYTSQVQFGEYS